MNYGERSYQVLIQRIQGRDKFVKNTYSVKKRSFEIAISRTDVTWAGEWSVFVFADDVLSGFFTEGNRIWR